MATLLGTKYQKNVLLIDNDPQGNASQFFDCYRKDEKCGAAKILERERPGIFTDVAAGVDLINANMTLLEADNELRTSEDRQDNRFAEYMEKAASIYDYCIIDKSGWCTQFCFHRFVFFSYSVFDYCIINDKCGINF